MSPTTGTRLTADEVTAWAQRLTVAAADRVPIEPLTATHPDLSVADAYAIQLLGVERRRAGGARLAGHKIGLTAPAVQAQLGVDAPDYGALLDDMRVADGGVLERGRLIAPRVEAEVAFLLGAPLRGPGVTEAEVSAATAQVAAAIEIVDSRVVDWRITLADTVADNASSAAFVIGTPVAVGGLELGALGARLERDGELVEAGSTAAVLGDPRTAVAWLANALSVLGTTLQAGQVVLSGAATRMVDASAGDHFTAHLDGLGSVSVSFSEGLA